MSALRDLLGQLGPEQVRSLVAKFDPGELRALEHDLAESARRSLAEFVRQAWPIVEPGTPLRWNWHVDAVCSHLEAVADGGIRNLVINIPPGCLKSSLVSVFWPAWMWIRRPEWRAIFSSYAEALATRDAVKTRAIVESDWYQRAFVRGAWKLSGDQNLRELAPGLPRRDRRRGQVHRPASRLRCRR